MDDASRHRDRHRIPVFGAPIDTIDLSHAVQRISTWAKTRESRAVYLCNAHSAVTARRDPAFFSKAIRDGDLVLPDGAPIAWMLRRQGASDQRRVSGPDLMWAYCEEAAIRGDPIYLLGAAPVTLDALQQNLRAAFPGLRIAGAWSPPFRPLTDKEDANIVTVMNNSGASTVWVGLGCPRQERWIAAHRGHVQAVMIGVGAAFDFHAGTIRRAPAWMRNNGLEWLHRLCWEPRRLGGRYATTNILFLYFAALQLLGKVNRSN